jgi:hypothetical protein
MSIVSAAAAKSNKPPAPSWHADSLGLLDVEFFFSRQRVVSQFEGSADTIELAYAQANTEALLDKMLEHGAGEGRSGLAALYEKGSHFTTNFDRVTLPPIDIACLPLSLHPLEEPIDGRTMHGNLALVPRLLD